MPPKLTNGMSALPLPEDDPFVTEVLYLLPPQVASRMTEAEKEQLYRALQKGSGRSRHKIDLRFSIPLFYSGLYVVLQVGKDRRGSHGGAYYERRRTARSLLESGALFVACLVALVASAAGLYWVKGIAGINIFPKEHLRDFIPINQNKHWFEKVENGK